MTTSNKTSVVAAINEINNNLSGSWFYSVDTSSISCKLSQSTGDWSSWSSLPSGYTSDNTIILTVWVDFGNGYRSYFTNLLECVVQAGNKAYFKHDSSNFNGKTAWAIIAKNKN